jgi:hypothetical protein
MIGKLLKLKTKVEILFYIPSSNNKTQYRLLKSNDVFIIIANRFQKDYSYYKIICKFGIGNIVIKDCVYSKLI